MKKTNVFTVIGIIVSVVAAVAGIAYAVYYFINKRCCLCDGDCYEFDCTDCDEDCCDCPAASEAIDGDAEDVVE